MRKIAVLVGNGLAISLYHHLHPALKAWHPSSPLSWAFFAPGNPALPLHEAFPCFAYDVQETRKEVPGGNDFDVLRRFLDRVRGDSAPPYGAQAAVEARHFLALAFSHFQHLVWSHSAEDWSWYEWFRVYAPEIRVGISFNYDLILEDLMSLGAGSVPIRPFPHSADSRWVFKPHGSIDYELETAVVPNLRYPLTSLFDMNDAPLRIIRRQQLLKPRIEPVAVLPGEETPYEDGSWVDPGFALIDDVGLQFTDIVIIGHSYGAPDRAEVNRILDALSPSTRAYVADPNPSAALLKKLSNGVRRVETWPNGPQTIGEA